MEVQMGRKKDKPGNKVISVRVTEGEMETIREAMKITRQNASTIMREAIRLVVAQTFSP
jgi:hypothetical protein